MLIEKSVNFYRQSRARGAANLFANALAQVGITKLTKFILFKLWANGNRYRAFLKRRNRRIVDRAYFVASASFSFQAWKQYVRLTVNERDTETIEKLQDSKRKLLEADKKQKEEKKFLETIVSGLQKDNVASKKALRDKDEEIASLKAQLCTEQCRVVGLVGLAGALKNLSGTLEGAVGSSEAVFRHGMAAHLRHPATPAYADLFDATARVQLQEKNEQLQESSNGPSGLSTAILLRWVNALSLRAKTETDERSDKKIDAFMPPFKQADGIAALRDGEQLSRVVAVLVQDAIKFYKQQEEQQKLVTGEDADADLDVDAGDGEEETESATPSDIVGEDVVGATESSGAQGAGAGEAVLGADDKAPATLQPTLTLTRNLSLLCPLPSAKPCPTGSRPTWPR